MPFFDFWDTVEGLEAHDEELSLLIERLEKHQSTVLAYDDYIDELKRLQQDIEEMQYGKDYEDYVTSHVSNAVTALYHEQKKAESEYEYNKQEAIKADTAFRKYMEVTYGITEDNYAGYDL